MHGIIRNSFRKKYSDPVLLDWSGRLPALVQIQKDSANIYLLDRRGRGLATEQGECGDKAWRRLTGSADLVFSVP